MNSFVMCELREVIMDLEMAEQSSREAADRETRIVWPDTYCDKAQKYWEKIYRRAYQRYTFNPSYKKEEA